jgi:hypothetical protein
MVWSIVFANVNDDDKQDLIVIGLNPYILAVYLNIDDEKFADPTIYQINKEVLSVTAKDQQCSDFPKRKLRKFWKFWK